ncbi:MAG: hypothetical protein AB8H79_00425 [Myxococcota bacterium]
MARVWLVMGMILAGCNGAGDGADDGTGDPPDPIGRGECSNDGAPTFTLQASAAEPQLYETSEGIRCLPTVRIEARDVEDVDGDLTFYEMEVWFDGVIDGRVLQEGIKLQTKSAVDGDDCKVPSLPGIGMNIGIAGGGTTSPAFNTETEFGVIVQDDNGNSSNDGVTQVVSVVTPGPVTEADCE